MALRRWESLSNKAKVSDDKKSGVLVWILNSNHSFFECILHYIRGHFWSPLDSNDPWNFYPILFCKHQIIISDKLKSTSSRWGNFDVWEDSGGVLNQSRSSSSRCCENAVALSTRPAMMAPPWMRRGRPIRHARARVLPWCKSSWLRDVIYPNSNSATNWSLLE